MAYQEDVNLNLNVLSGTTAGFTAIMGGMSAMTSSFAQMGTEAANTFGGIDALIVGTTTLIAAFSVEAASAFGEFEQGMKIVQTVSNQTSAAISELSSKANEMSVAYRTSIGDITDGLQTLGRAGLNSVNEQLEVLESGLQTAKLEGRNLNGVLEEIIQNTAMLGGDLKSINFGEQAEYLNSLMVGTSMTAPIDSHDISQTLQYSGGTLAAAGGSIDSAEGRALIEDYMGTVAAFAQRGVKGSMAGTALRAFFTKPASQDKQVTAGLEAIGLSPEDLWEDGGNSMKKVSEQIAIIENQMKRMHLSTIDQVEIWGKIVGAKMGQQMMKLDSSTIKEVTRDIQDAQSAEELAAQTLQTYNQKISEFQQQGEVAYREFGEKVARILTPLVDLGTKVMELLSNPVVNTGAFIAIGSLVGHGLSTAWNMLKSIYGQLRQLFSDTTTALTNINALASGVGTGFQQSTSQVDYLNTKLHETDSTLQAIQARALGLKPGYLIPGGLAGDKIPRDTLRIMDENVVRDDFGVMGGREGQYYSGEKAALFEKKTKEEIAVLEDTLNQKKIDTENEISEIRRKMTNVEELADEEHAARVKSLNAEYNAGLLNIKEEMDMYRGFNDDNPQGLKSIDDWEREKQQALKTTMMNELKLSEAKKRSFISEYKPGYEEEIVNLEKELDDYSSEIQSKKNLLKDVQKQGTTKLQTRLELNSVAAAEKWYNDLLEKELAGTITEEEAYSLSRTREVWEDYQNQYALEQMKKEGVLPTYRSRIFEELSPTDEMLAQIYESGDYKAVADARKLANKNAAEIFAGKDSISAKASQNSEARLKSFESRLQSADSRLRQFGTDLSNAGSRIKRNLGDSLRGTNYIKDNASMLQNKGTKLVATELELAGKSMTTALNEVATRLNISSAEFAALYDSEALAEMGLGQLSAQALNFERALIEAMVPMDMEEEERAKLIVALQESYRAHIQEAGAAGGSTFSKFGEVGEGAEKSAGRLAKLGSAAGTVVDFLGGPLMAGMMAVTVAMEVYNAMLGQWQERVQEATDEMSEATDNLNTASENIQELYQNENNQVSESILDKAVDSQYESIYDASQLNPNSLRGALGNLEVSQDPDLSYNYDEDRMLTEEEIAERQEAVESITLAKDENIQALKENTLALLSATNKYQQALGKQSKEFNDPLFGYNGFFTNAVDNAMITNAEQISLRDEGFLDNNSPVLNNWQSDKNYMGSTEFAPIMSMDFFKYGTEEGLQSFFGNDYNQIIGLMRSMNNHVGKYGEMNGYSNLQSQASMIQSMDANTFATSQMMWKNNPEDFQKLGKQMFRYEQQYNFNRSAQSDYRLLAEGVRPEKGTTGKRFVSDKNDRKALAKNMAKGMSQVKLTVTDKNLIRTVKKLVDLSDGKLSEANVLAMGQLQQLQDMYTVANESIAPGINQTVQGVFDNVTATGLSATNAGSAAAGADGAAANAASIAAFLGANAQSTAIKSAYDKYKLSGGERYKTQDEFEAALGKGELPQYQRMVLESLAGTGWSLNHPGASPKMISQNAYRLAGPNSELWESDASFVDKMNTATGLIYDFAQGAVLAGYSQSQIGEYGSGNSGGSGGSGGGSGDSGGSGNKDSGTKKERVDLVLCNKKEIPKLNVNLFKKAPNFTILNKNFKLRDIKINSEDKPKAIMNAVKNGIIETQKRMDPKIIQDETAEYNPVEATDGSSTPSGTTKTTT